jgi:hypothetical protein
MNRHRTLARPVAPSTIATCCIASRDPNPGAANEAIPLHEHAYDHPPDAVVAVVFHCSQAADIDQPLTLIVTKGIYGEEAAIDLAQS